MRFNISFVRDKRVYAQAPPCNQVMEPAGTYADTHAGYAGESEQQCGIHTACRKLYSAHRLCEPHQLI